jgi:hypothetical protein
MNSNNMPGSAWSTSSFGDGTDTKPIELKALGEHLLRCRHGDGRWIALRCGAETLRGFATGRVITCLLLLLALLAGAGLLMS